ncbi:SNF2 family N-terminal domain-containing protein [Lineolata rhizophorae]|uniref:SNF2 family N-terminal domain-containing protein n=1 Tax=Lineolata rhizophorae TaxID=578093 RepID=A0A6A6NTX2_9PEZI|nr:SNF2 family N-terminal domain-containing protein [Lineolata rhizophorae]
MATYIDSPLQLSLISYNDKDLSGLPELCDRLRDAASWCEEPEPAEPPPQKRRKMTGGMRKPTKPPPAKGALGNDEMVILAHMDLDLAFCGSSNKSSKSRKRSNTSNDSFELCFSSFDSSIDYTLNLYYITPRRRTTISHDRPVGFETDEISIHFPRSKATKDIGSNLDRLVHMSRRLKAASNRTAYMLCDFHTGSDGSSFKLEVKLLWRAGRSILDDQRPWKDVESHILAEMFADEESRWTLQDFFDAVHIPRMDMQVAPQIPQILTEAQLYPFQQRAVDWLLRREGVHYTPKGLREFESPELGGESLADDYEAQNDAYGRVCYVSKVRRKILTDSSSAEKPISICGGILAEEMGLGKTVELIALMCAHKRSITSETVFDEYSGSELVPTGATLIITPQSILDQWKLEINSHAPHLRVMIYRGMPSATSKEAKDKESQIVSQFCEYDVVLTTYTVLSREIHYAQAAPERNLRNPKKHESRRSPLVRFSWWRVCLDEAQMVERGVSQAATVARIIPRINAWAVSGTPLRKDTQDLLGLLIFLRYEPYCSETRLWNNVDKRTFRKIFGRIALRHTKDKIRDELRLPPQKRVVITVPFTTIEDQHYDQLVQQMCDAVGLTAEGAPTTDDWDPNHPNIVQAMRTWLARLRQTCLHPHVGHRNRRALGGSKNKPLRTVEEVLESMIDQNEQSMRLEERNLLMAQLRKGHVLGNAKNIKMRAFHALEVYREAMKRTKSVVGEIELELEAEKRKIRLATGKDVDSEDEHEDEDGEEEKESRNGRLGVIKRLLRPALESYHVCAFFVATSYFQIKSNEAITVKDSEDFHRLEALETAGYDKAKQLRKRLLRDVSSRAEKCMQEIHNRSKNDAWAKLNEVPLLDDLGGIENRKLLDAMDDLTDLLNRQQEQLVAWRQKVIDILLLPLVDEDEGKETTGEEYEDSTKAQDELYVYTQALRALIADRHQAISGQTNLLAEHEMKMALAQANVGAGHAPELLLNISKYLDKLKLGPEVRPLRAIIAELRSLATNLEFDSNNGKNYRATAELGIVERQLKELQRVSTAQIKRINEFEREMDLFHRTMNNRVEFYRQLQGISDTVAPWKEDLDEELDEQELHNTQRQICSLEDKVATLKTKRRFLLHLRAESQKDSSARICVICQGDFENGVLTVCGHQYCKDCIRMWWYQHRTCPVCKRHLHTVDFHDITYKPKELRAQEERNHHHGGGPSPEGSPSKSGNLSPTKETQTTIYSDMSQKTMDEIRSIDLNGSYGTKIDTIAR